MEFYQPECKIDFPALLREAIITDVRCHGFAERCSLQMSSAFVGWDHSQIDNWCAEHNLVIIARHTDGRIVIMRATRENLAAYGIDTPQISHALEKQGAILRAEVEAMDWPKVIGE